MPTVDISINARHYSLQCGQGEEVRLKRLAQYVDSRVREAAQEHGQLGDARLLVLTSLLISDELDDALAEIKRLQGRDPADIGTFELEHARVLDRIAERLEQLAANIEKA